MSVPLEILPGLCVAALGFIVILDAEKNVFGPSRKKELERLRRRADADWRNAWQP
jgi:hypothetical protein